MPQEKLNEYQLFDIDEETYKKSKDIKPALDLGKLEPGSSVELTVLSKEPRKVKHKNKFKKDKNDPDEIETSIIDVQVHKILRASDNDVLEIDVNEENGLWLSSKSLSLGFLRLYKENNTLENVKARIKIGLAEYKEFGENRVYNVTRMD